MTGDDPETRYFGEGIIDDIIFNAIQCSGLAGDLAHLGSHLSQWTDRPAEDRAGLGVRYVLSGSVRREQRPSADQSELSDVESGSVIWVDRYDGDLTELFDLQDRIATRIVWSPRAACA